MRDAVLTGLKQWRFMKTETPAPRSSRLGLILRLIGASLLCFLNLAIVLPNLKTYSNHQFSYGPGTAYVLAWLFSPLIPIFIGAACCRLVEEIGWALLILFLAMQFIG
jgi:hypothetical protein